jgi:hypothetical protein
MQPVVRLIVSATCSQIRLGPTPKRSNHMLITLDLRRGYEAP